MAEVRGIVCESSDTDGSTTSHWAAPRREATDEEDGTGCEGTVSLRIGDRLGFGDEGGASEEELGGGVFYVEEEEEEEKEKVLEEVNEVVERGSEREEEAVWVPKHGAFYMHDDRFLGRGRSCCRHARRNFGEPSDRRKWQHDKYEEMQKLEKVARGSGRYHKVYSKNVVGGRDASGYQIKQKHNNKANQPSRVIKGRGPVKYTALHYPKNGSWQMLNKKCGKREPHGIMGNADSARVIASVSPGYSASNMHPSPSSSISQISVMRKRDMQHRKTSGSSPASVPEDNRFYVPRLIALAQRKPLDASHAPYSERSIHLVDTDQSVNISLRSSVIWSTHATEPPQMSGQGKDSGYSQHFSSNDRMPSVASSPSAVDHGLLNFFCGLDVAQDAWAENGIVHSHETATGYKGLHNGDHSVVTTPSGCTVQCACGFGNNGTTWLPVSPTDAGQILGPSYPPCITPHGSLYAQSSEHMQPFSVDGLKRDEVGKSITSKGNKSPSACEVAKTEHGQRSIKAQRYSQMNFSLLKGPA